MSRDRCDMTPARIITGRRASLESALTTHVAELKTADPLAAVHVLVGSTLLRPYLRRVLAQHLGGSLNVNLLTPGELGLLLGEQALIDNGRQPLPLLADQVLSAQAASTAPGAFAPVADLPGFPGALARTLRDLRMAGATPATLAGAAAAEPNQDDPDTVRLRSLAGLFEWTANARAQRYGIDDALIAADPGGLETGLVVYGVWDVPALVRDLLRRTADSGRQLTVFLPQSEPATESALASFRSFLVDVLSAGETRLDHDPATTDLARAQHFTFAAPVPDPPKPDDSLRLLAAPDPGREVRHVIGQLLSWADEGIAFREMAIAYRDGATYRPLIEAALRNADIPAYMHEGTPLTERPVGRRILALLELAGAKTQGGAWALDRAAVIGFLSDARLPKDTYEHFGAPSIPRWETITRRAGVTGGIDQWRTRLEQYQHELLARADGDDEPPTWVLERAASARQLLAFVVELHDRLSARPDQAAWVDHVAWLDALLDRYVADATPVRGALADLAQLDDLIETTSAEGFDRAVVALLDGLRDRDLLGSRAGAFGLRGVNVIDAVSLRHLGFRAVAIVGLAERSFPPPPREDPLLLDDRRMLLHQDAHLPIQLRARGGDPEPLQFTVDLDAASARVLASYARSGMDGRRQLPSTFFRALAGHLAGVRVTAEAVDTTPIPGLQRLPAGRVGPLDPSSAATATDRRRALLEDESPGAIGLVRRRLPRTAMGAKARDARRLTRLTAYDGVVSKKQLATLRGLPRFDRLSPTKLEEYASCPQRHLLAGILGLREIEEPEDIQRLSPLDKGDAVHRILERFLRDRPTGAPTLKAETSRLRKITKTVLDGLERDGRTGYPLLWSVDRVRLEEDLDRWLQTQYPGDLYDGTWTKHGFEVRFGLLPYRDEADHPDPLSCDEPLEIVLPGQPNIELSGYVDRVDYNEGAGRFSVVDYKTGKMWGKEEDALRGGRTLQLPLYILAIARALGVDPTMGTARYESVDRKGKFRNVAYDGQLLQGTQSDLVALLTDLVSARADGDFHREPGSGGRGDDNCNYCSVADACDPRRRALLRRKQKAKQIVGHAERAEKFP